MESVPDLHNGIGESGFALGGFLFSEYGILLVFPCFCSIRVETGGFFCLPAETVPNREHFFIDRDSDFERTVYSA